MNKFISNAFNNAKEKYQEKSRERYMSTERAIEILATRKNVPVGLLEDLIEAGGIIRENILAATGKIQDE